MTAILLALGLLGWEHGETPPIVIAERPPYALSWAQKQALVAWVTVNTPETEGVIYVAGWHRVYKGAVKGRHAAVVELAAALAHERCHLGQSLVRRMEKAADVEGECYDAQLAALKTLKAPNYVRQRVLSARRIVAGR